MVGGRLVRLVGAVSLVALLSIAAGLAFFLLAIAYGRIFEVVFWK